MRKIEYTSVAYAILNTFGPMTASHMRVSRVRAYSVGTQHANYTALPLCQQHPSYSLSYRCPQQFVHGGIHRRELSQAKRCCEFELHS